MYTVVIVVPFRRKSEFVGEVASDWGYALKLLRDSFSGRFGKIVVAAPEIPLGDGLIGNQEPYALHAEEDGISFVKIANTQWRARQFWKNYFKIRKQLQQLAQDTDVLHTDMGNLYQPYPRMGFEAAWRAGVCTVFVQDMDIIQQIRDQSRDKGLPGKLRAEAYAAIYYQLTRRVAARADLSLLKSKAAFGRYAPYAKNPKNFMNTSFSISDVISDKAIQEKCTAVESSSPLQCLYLGRLVDRKNIDHGIHAVAKARQMGANVEFNIIGQGPDEERLQAKAKELGVADAVHFLGSRPYGPELMKEIQAYPVFLYSATIEDTPRALFDGLAAGCALASYRTSYTEEVVEMGQHGQLAPLGDTDALAKILCDLDRDRSRVASLIRAAGQNAAYHAAENWYQRRAEWTIEAYEKHHHHNK